MLAPKLLCGEENNFYGGKNIAKFLVINSIFITFATSINI